MKAPQQDSKPPIHGSCAALRQDPVPLPAPSARAFRCGRTPGAATGALFFTRGEQGKAGSLRTLGLDAEVVVLEGGVHRMLVRAVPRARISSLVWREEARCPGSTDAAQAFGAGVGHQECGCIAHESLTHPFATVVKLLSRVPSLDGVLDRHSKPPNKGGSFSDGENKHPCRSDQRVLGE